MAGASAIGRGTDWHEALDDARRQSGGTGTDGCDLALLFASHHYAGDFRALVRAAGEATGARTLIGCSGQGVIAGASEVEDTPAIAIATMVLPGARIIARHISMADLSSMQEDAACEVLTGVPPRESNGWLIFADPYSFDAERLLACLSDVYAQAPLIGGMASGDPAARSTHLFIDGDVFDDGAVIASIGGAWELRAVVAQGAAPIGRPWTITGVDRNVIRTIGSRPALEVLVETLQGLPGGMQERAQRNLLVGIAMDEYRETFGRGDFLVRNLVGADRESGAIAVSALPRAGQTLQFQVRDAEAADEDLREMLDAAQAGFAAAAPPAGALLCACNGRGAGLFGAPDHDAAAVAGRFGSLPVAGFFCNGEIGPVGGRPFLHGFTASIGFLVPNEATAESPS